MHFALAALLLLVNQIEDQAHDPAAVAAAASELRQALLVLKQDPISRLSLPLELELERVVSIRAAALLRNVSVDSIARHFAAYIVRTGNKVRGIKLKHVLDLGSEMPRLPQPRRKNPVALRKRRTGQGAEAAMTPVVQEAP